MHDHDNDWQGLTVRPGSAPRGRSGEAVIALPRDFGRTGIDKPLRRLKRSMDSLESEIDEEGLGLVTGRQEFR